MALSTTFNTPNYVGELFQLGREDTPFLSAIGGLTGGRRADGILFPWQGYDLRTSTPNRVRVEGANAPSPENRVRVTMHNVVEIHQETIATTYTKQAATGQFATTGSAHPGAVGVSGTNPVQNEHVWQIAQELKAMARDINQSFINGTFANPSTNDSPRQTRGLLEAITTNVVDLQGDDLGDTEEEYLLDLMQKIWDSGGIREGETRTLLTNSTQKRRLTAYFKSQGYEVVPASRNVGGVNVTSVVTDFGNLAIMLEPAMPQDTVAVVSLEECAPRFLEIPGKGFLFREPLAKTGAREEDQLYCEVGLEYGIEKHHGKIVNCAVPTPQS